jgi:hypothetical protein
MNFLLTASVAFFRSRNVSLRPTTGFGLMPENSGIIFVEREVLSMSHSITKFKTYRRNIFYMYPVSYPAMSFIRHSIFRYAYTKNKSVVFGGDDPECYSVHTALA